jgi:hypothetical protein
MSKERRRQRPVAGNASAEGLTLAAASAAQAARAGGRAAGPRPIECISQASPLVRWGKGPKPWAGPTKAADQ